MANGFVVDAIVIRQDWKLEGDNVEGSTKFSPLGVGMSGGYYYHVGRHFYVYPTASLTYNTISSGDATLQGFEYKVPKIQPNGSVHVGWEIRI